MSLARLSGVLAHPTSFPSVFGIGDLGQGAYEFVDFLHKAKQRLWQVLPLCPTSFGDSPYQSFSTFAGNTLLISPALLAEENYLSPEDLLQIPDFDPLRVDYGQTITYKTELYQKAFQSFETAATAEQTKAFKTFCTQNAAWLNDFVLFIALKDYFIEERRNTFESPEYKSYKKLNKKSITTDSINDCFYGAVWDSWPEELRDRQPKALKAWSEKLSEQLKFLKFLQYEFFRQWRLLKNYANKKDIKIIGDIPIFVAFDSSDVWANPEAFYLDSKGYPTVVAGVPPDYFSATGQLWGNPIYNWPEHAKNGYTWWISRIKSSLKLVDILRIDHFRGFDEYWAVKYGDKTAAKGKWCPGPGKGLFLAIENALGKLPIIAEDLGLITDSVVKLRDELNFPGMKILQFAFDCTPTNEYLPHNYNTVNTVVYSGTHDNDTSRGWYAKESEAVKDHFRRYLNVDGGDVAWDMIRLGLASTAGYAISPLQDIMSLDSDSRMNTPGVASGNWQFRYRADMLNQDMADRLAGLTEFFNRA